MPPKGELVYLLGQGQGIWIRPGLRKGKTGEGPIQVKRDGVRGVVDSFQ